MAGFLEDDRKPFAGIAKGMDHSKLPKGSVLNATGVRLNNNALRDLAGLEEFLDAVLDDPSELRWLDLSHNQLTRVDPVILKYPRLSCVYLHGNKIESIREIDKLSALEELSKFTAMGNPIEERADYRMYVPHQLQKVRSLDFIRVTPTDRDRVAAWHALRPKR